MKFLCDACGKKYSTSEPPVRGKVYRLTCKACGHVIVLKGPTGEASEPQAPSGGRPAPGVPAGGGPVATDAESGFEGLELLPPELTGPPIPVPPAAAARPADLLPPPPAPDKDELADFAAAIAGTGPIASLDPGTGADPFAGGRQGGALAAARRASLPDGPAGGGAGRPTVRSPAGEPSRTGAGLAVALRREPGRRAGLPPAVIVLGVAIIVGVTAVALLRGGQPADAPPAASPPAADLPPPAPPPLPRPPAEAATRGGPPAIRPEVSAATAEDRPPVTAPEPRRRVAEKPAAPRPEAVRPGPDERRPEPRGEPPRTALAATAAPPTAAPLPVASTPTASSPAASSPAAANPAAASSAASAPAVPVAPEPLLPDAATALTPEVVQGVIRGSQPQFAACMAQGGSDLKLEGRRVVLKFSVAGSGAVNYPTLDDQTLTQTELGLCLKKVARGMVFPRFKGDPYHLEVPLTLSN
jgi:DNA-directed RNA polymerase subunit RPC12/RpoP